MKGIIFFLSVIFIVQPANATDLPNKKRVTEAPKLTTINKWDGFYVGGIFSVNQLNNYQKYEITNPPIPSNTKGEKAVTGLQFGYNKLFGEFVIGLQASIDMGKINIKDNLGRGSKYVYPDEIKTTLNSLYSLNARVGYLFQPQLLFYIKGGLVSARFEYEHAAYGDGWFIGSAKDTRSGWNIGSGFEYLVDQNWSIFAEYNRSYFGKKTIIYDYISEVGYIGSHPWNNENSEDRLRLGINFHF